LEEFDPKWKIFDQFSMEVYKKASSIFSSDWMVITFSDKSTDPSMSVWRSSIKFWQNNSWTLSDTILDRLFGNKQQEYFDHVKESWYWTMQIGMLWSKPLGQPQVDKQG
jgi:hypothetical protein